MISLLVNLLLKLCKLFTKSWSLNSVDWCRYGKKNPSFLRVSVRIIYRTRFTQRNNDIYG